MEEYLTDTSIVRCHRSYLVNTTKIVKFKKERGRAKVTLAAPSNKELVVKLVESEKTTEDYKDFIGKTQKVAVAYDVKLLFHI